MRKIIFALIIASSLFVFITQAALAQEQPVQADNPGITKKVLDNGLTVLIKPEKGSGLVAVVAFIRAGSGQETIQTAGIGNFVAQLVLAGTISSSAEEVASIADEVGGNIAVQWHPDYTEIKAITTTAMFNKAMRLIGESLTEANFEKQWVDKVRADILRNMQTDSDDVFSQAYGKLRELMYQDNGYRRPELGFERTIKLATPQDLQQFYSKYYVPNNIILSIAGDVTIEQALDRANKAFAGVEQKQLPKDRGVPDEELPSSKYLASEADIPAAYLMLGWLAPGVTSADYPAVAVASNAIGGGKGSILFKELRQKRGMGYPVGTMFPMFRYQSHMIAYIVTDPYKIDLPNMTPKMVLDEVKNAMLQEVNSLKDKPLSEKDLQRAKGYTIGSYALTQQHLMDRAFQMGWFETIGLGYDMYWKLPNAIDKVTASDVQRAANKYFQNYAAVLMLPKAKSASTN